MEYLMVRGARLDLLMLLCRDVRFKGGEEGGFI